MIISLIRWADNHVILEPFAPVTRSAPTHNRGFMWRSSWPPKTTTNSIDTLTINIPGDLSCTYRTWCDYWCNLLITRNWSEAREREKRCRFSFCRNPLRAINCSLTQTFFFLFALIQASEVKRSTFSAAANQDRCRISASEMPWQLRSCWNHTGSELCYDDCLIFYFWRWNMRRRRVTSAPAVPSLFHMFQSEEGMTHKTRWRIRRLYVCTHYQFPRRCWSLRIRGLSVSLAPLFSFPRTMKLYHSKHRLMEADSRPIYLRLLLV